MNTSLNSVNAELHDEGFGEADEFATNSLAVPFSTFSAIVTTTVSPSMRSFASSRVLLSRFVLWMG